MKSLKKLCSPAALYFVISLISLLILIFQNAGNTNVLCVGNYGCNIESTIVVFVFNFLYVAFWTWVLNLICNAGHKGIAWFLVLLPFILMFVGLGILMLNQGVFAV
jgi:hypothetical protein